MTVLTFFAGVGLYIAATWGRGEGWFGRDLAGEDEEGGDKKVAEGRTIGYPPEKMTSEATQESVIEGGAEGEIGENREAKGKGKETEEVGEGRRASDGSFQFRVPSIDGEPVKQT